MMPIIQIMGIVWRPNKERAPIHTITTEMRRRA
jgi:hypothetical protein